MRTTKVTLVAALMAVMGTFNASAAFDSIPSLKINKVNITPTGRVLLDGAFFMPGGDGLNAGVAIPDIRVGAKVNYGNWDAKIDVGYGFGKISMKDVYIRTTVRDGVLKPVDMDSNFAIKF